MRPASRTPEGEPSRCPICGKLAWLEPSWPTRDAPCPYCGSLLWFDLSDRWGTDAFQSAAHFETCKPLDGRRRVRREYDLKQKARRGHPRTNRLNQLNPRLPTKLTSLSLVFLIACLTCALTGLALDSQRLIDLAQVFSTGWGIAVICLVATALSSCEQRLARSARSGTPRA